jgi:hypothetical protein
MNDVKLVDGTFTTEDSREVLFHLLREKIKFHNRRLFSLDERLGVSDEHSKKRVRELQLSMTEVQDLLDKANLLGKQLNIRCDIHIELVDEAPNLTTVSKKAGTRSV